MANEQLFHRTELLLGHEAMQWLSTKRVILFGVGGVGSWCAESLVRSGIRQLTIVDFDCVCSSNINRQLVATTKTVGQAKVEVLRERLLAINPDARITALQQVFTAATADSFNLASYDYIIDAIDSLKDKLLLILMATSLPAGTGQRVGTTADFSGACPDAYRGTQFFSSMGAALKMDPTRIRVTEFWKVQGDPLARALRRRMKQTKQFPQRKFLCVFSDELLPNGEHHATSTTDLQPATSTTDLQPATSTTDLQPDGKQVNGTIAHITAIFGFMLASLVVHDAIS